MIAAVKHSHVRGRLAIAGSKSMMQRACVLALLRDGDTVIENPSISDDSNSVLHIIEKLGSIVTHEAGLIRITGNPRFNFSGTLNCYESGLAFRMLVPVVSTCAGRVSLTGEGSLARRPMNFFDKVLPGLGVKVRSAGGFLPVEVTGPMHPEDISVDGSVSSQFITGLLFAYAHVALPGTRIRISNTVSRPYLDMSVAVLRMFGYSVLQPHPDEFVIGEKTRIEGALHMTIPGDWSGGAFFLVAAAIAGKLAVSGLDTASQQGDHAIMNVLKKAGADVTYSGGEILVNNNNKLNAFQFDATHTPDLFPPLACLALYCEGTSSIDGLERLHDKESNRQETLIDVFTRIGANIWVEGNTLKIKGMQPLRPAVVDGYSDHRIIMAAAVAALGSGTEFKITGAEAVSKSYPAFFQQLMEIGAQVSLT